jgi:hypothetical protein
MPANGVVLVRGSRPPRRWPAVLVTLTVIFSLALTGFLFFRDRQNAEAATGSRVNAPQDALALATLSRLARTLDLDASMRHTGVLGLRSIALHDFQSLVVGPLGGALDRGVGQWTLALDGGWGCLRWLHGRDNAGSAIASLGVCSDDAPLFLTQSVTRAQFTRVEVLVTSRELAVVDAAKAAAAIASSPGNNLTISVRMLATYFAHLRGTGFRSWAAPTGVTVMTRASTACLQPTAQGVELRVSLGPCA